MTWYYNDKVYDITPEEYQGFVYEITEIASNKKYIVLRNKGEANSVYIVSDSGILRNKISLFVV